MPLGSICINKKIKGQTLKIKKEYHERDIAYKQRNFSTEAFNIS